MGALQGQERQMLENLIGNPTEAFSGVKGQEAYKAKLKEARQMIEDKKRIYGKPTGKTQPKPAEQGDLSNAEFELLQRLRREQGELP